MPGEEIEEVDLNEEINCRVLITNRQVGYIIGKKGQRIQEVREQCGKPFFMSVLKSETRNCEDRVMALRGLIPQVAKAIQLTADLIILGTKDTIDDTDTTEIKFLVHKFLVGSIIGKGGQTIQAMQTETECKIQIGAEDLPGSTEKAVTVTGTPANLYEATIRVMTQLRSFPLRAGTRLQRYKPGSAGMFGMGMPGMGMPGQGPYGMQGGGMQGGGMQGGGMQGGGMQGGGMHGGGRGGGGPPPQQGYYGMQGGGMPPYGGGPPQQQQVTSTQKIAIPTVCAGVVIGRGGSIIRDIRSRTGCSISIQDADDSSPNERVVVLTGGQQGIQAAIVMIRSLVEQYQPGPQDY